MRYLITLLLLTTQYLYAQERFALEMGGNFGKAFPYLTSTNPNHATTSNASVTELHIDAVFKTEYGHLQGMAGLHFGGFEFKVSPASRVTGIPTYDTTSKMVSRGRLCVMGGGLYTVPVNKELSFRISAQAGFGIAMNGLFSATTLVATGEVCTGFSLYNTLSLGLRYVIIPGRFDGYEYANHRNYSITPSYGIHGIMFELGARLSPRKRTPKPEKERIIRYRGE